MKLANLKIEDYIDSIKKVNAILNDETKFGPFLDEAIAEMPIIDDIMEQIAILEKYPESSLKEKAYSAAQRDLTVLLALQNLEKNQSTLVSQD